MFEEDISPLVIRYLETATTDIDQWIDLLHDDIVIEFPYGESAGLLPQLSGKETIKKSTEMFLESVPGIRFNNAVVSPSLNPDEAFATYEVDVKVPSTGRNYKQRYIAAFTRKDGKIIKMVEYYDPTNFNAAFR
ncbi:nuclear transport factor 2 family protein [Pedobacter jamesrossensis]|uniref:Nuclear transport factor 2 family protein n=1 Tax=Pedobacter jamesrossensis TaxID=1908238 RepID=A0ABV8NMJ3_9SPHI